jgi:hypothetical protein
MNAQTDLAKVVRARRAFGLFPRSPERRQQERGQDGDDGDDDKEFDECESQPRAIASHARSFLPARVDCNPWWAGK